MAEADAPCFYLLFAEGADEQALHANFDAVRMRADLYTVYTSMTRSELYHAVRDLTGPKGLLVAPLSAHPKFRGMDAGALKWLKRRSND